MEPWLMWIIVGASFIALELIVPGGIIIFLGVSGIIVGLALRAEVIHTTPEIFGTFIISSFILLLFVRTFFMRSFEGPSTVQDVDEKSEVIGTIVSVAEEITPFREGRVHFRGTTWQARSEAVIIVGSSAVIENIDGNILIVKPI